MSGEAVRNVLVRDAAAADADAIAHIHVRTWQGAYEHLFGAERLARLSEAPRAVYWRERIENREPRTHILVSEADGELCGFASLGPSRDVDADPATTGELYAIYVLPHAWGRGAGRALMTELLERLRADGFEQATLWVLEDNPRTRRFYELAGWTLDGAVKEDTFLDTRVREVRYRIEPGAASGR